MILRRSILLLVYRVGARSDVTEEVWRGVEKYIAWEQTRKTGYPRKAPLLAFSARSGAFGVELRLAGTRTPMFIRHGDNASVVCSVSSCPGA
jgi:hypothetical protein